MHRVCLLLAFFAACVAGGAEHGDRAYAALGASNTCGHGINTKNGFQFTVAAGLRARGIASAHLNRCVPATGPLFASACAGTFLPPTLAAATVEYLPNIEVPSIETNVQAWRSLVSDLLRRGALVVAVQLLERPQGSSIRALRHVRNLERAHAMMAAHAAQHPGRIETVLVNGTRAADGALFVSGDKHLNFEGHQAVAARILEAFGRLWAMRSANTGKLQRKTAHPGPGLLLSSNATSSEAGRESTPLGESEDGPKQAVAVQCAIGAELGKHVLSSRGFEPKPVGQGKVGWVSLERGSHLELCASAAPLTSKHEILLGFIRASALQLPPLGLVNVSCSAGCGSCTVVYRGVGAHAPCAAHNCSFDPRAKLTDRTSVTDFSALVTMPTAAVASAVPSPGGQLETVPARNAAAAAADCACTVTVSNSQEASDIGYRVVVRALITAPATAGVGRAFANIWVRAHARVSSSTTCCTLRAAAASARGHAPPEPPPLAPFSPACRHSTSTPTRS